MCIYLGAGWCSPPTKEPKSKRVKTTNYSSGLVSVVMLLNRQEWNFPSIPRRHDLTADFSVFWSLQSFYDFFGNVPCSVGAGVVLQLICWELCLAPMISWSLHYDLIWLNVNVSVCWEEKLWGESHIFLWAVRSFPSEIHHLSNLAGPCCGPQASQLDGAIGFFPPLASCTAPSCSMETEWKEGGFQVRFSSDL